jgi:hypothetical protein
MHSDEQKVLDVAPPAYVPPVRDPTGLQRVYQAETLECGLPVFTDVWLKVDDYGPYITINALKLAIDKRMADPTFGGTEIYFKFWTPQPPGSLKRKHRRVAMKAMVYVTEEGQPWVLLTTSRSE